MSAKVVVSNLNESDCLRQSPVVNFYSEFGTENCLLHCRSRRVDSTHSRLKAKETLSEENIKVFTRTACSESAVNGCGSCSATLSILEEVFPLGNAIPDIERPELLYSISTNFLARELRRNEQGYFILRQIQLFNIRGDRLYVKGMPSSNLLSGSTSSEQSLETLRQWLRQCTEFHSICGNAYAAHLPSRVIDVTPMHREGTEGVRLVETASTDVGTYVCLSHCWGKTPIHCITTPSTYESRKDFIPCNILTKNFLDAIMITRSLNIRYIWIDSICIIQNDSKDWESESSKMCDIYQQAYLTIAASSSPDSAGGCLSTTQPDLLIDLSTGAGFNISIGARMCDSRGLLRIPEEKNERYPLFTRAWVFQERLLSRRILYCNYGEFAFQCLEMDTCECDEHNMAPHFLQRKFPRFIARQEHRLLMADESARGLGKSLAKSWREIVCDYMPNSLSYQADILPAISGCAKIMNKRMGDEYIAGMWRQELHKDLLWFNLAGRAKLVRRPDIWTAPTWSWASIACGQAVEFAGIMNSGKTPMKYFLSHKILKIQRTASGANEWGRLTCASMEVEANLFPCLLYRSYSQRTSERKPKFDIHQYDKKHRTLCQLGMPGLDAYHGRIEFRPDVDLQTENLDFWPAKLCRNSEILPCATSPIYLLRLAQRLTNTNSTDYLMVVRKVETSSRTYARIGLAILGSHAQEQRMKWMAEV